MSGGHRLLQQEGWGDIGNYDITNWHLKQLKTSMPLPVNLESIVLFSLKVHRKSFTNTPIYIQPLYSEYGAVSGGDGGTNHIVQLEHS